MVKAPSILLVDQQTEPRLRLELFLKKIGYTVRTAENSEKGMELVLREIPSLLILSTNLHPTSAFTLCQAIKRNLAGGDLPVLFISSLSEEATRSEGARVHGNFWIPSEYSQNDLGADLYHLLNPKKDSEVPAYRALQTLPSAQNQSIQAPVETPPQPSPPAPVVVANTEVPRAQRETSAPTRSTPSPSHPSRPNGPVEEVHSLLESLAGSLYNTNQSLNSLIDYIEGLDKR